MGNMFEVKKEHLQQAHDKALNLKREVDSIIKRLNTEQTTYKKFFFFSKQSSKMDHCRGRDIWRWDQIAYLYGYISEEEFDSIDTKTSAPSVAQIEEMQKAEKVFLDSYDFRSLQLLINKGE